METLQTILLILQVLVAVGLIGFILIQHGKGADAGAAFGSGASSTVFGARGSGNFLTKTTSILAFVFLANSLALAYIASQRVQESHTSLLQQQEEVVIQQQAEQTATEEETPEIPAAPESEVPELPGE